MTKRASSMSDADRALARRKTAPRGIPVQVDPELTPPPSEPPRPESVRGYDSIPPPVQEALTVLADGLGNVTTALGKIWDLRKDGERMDRIESNLGTLAGAATRHETQLDQFVIPGIKDLMKAIDVLSQQLPLVAQQAETTNALMMTIDGRLRTLEGDLRVMAAEFSSAREVSASRHAAVQARLAEQEQRIETLERKARDKEVVSKALAKRERLKSTGIGGFVAIVVSAIAHAIGKAV